MKINAKRLIERLDALAEFGRDVSGGWSRFSFTPEYMQAQKLVQQWMKEAGMHVRVDAAGNLIGRLEGLEPNLPVVAAGSHIDTVKNGGKFDGSLGVVGALEVAQTIKENDIKHRHPVEVIVFVEEEGARFGSGLFGSRAVVGEISTEFLHQQKDNNGISLYQAMQLAGLDPEKITKARVPAGYYKAYFELHIEQGAILDSLGIPVGIVECIAGPVWLNVKLTGRACHAGATPMHLRQDALAAGAELILSVEKLALETGGSTVATVGKLSVQPGGINIIPGKVEFTIDIRSIDLEKRETLLEYIKKSIYEVSNRRNIACQVEELIRVDPVKLPESMINLLEEAAQEVGVPFHRLVSGPTHDAHLMTKITNVGMIFAPTRNGLSHCPEEWTDPGAAAACTQVLLNAILKVI